ncbi:MAG: hypothetical protein AAGI08_07675, partial [Bacteroidota bacterium]
MIRHLISRQKPVFGIDPMFEEYLDAYNRLSSRGVQYDDLRRYDESVPLYDEQGEDTLWVTVFFAQTEMRELHDLLRLNYAILKAGGDVSIMEHLYIDRIDLCMYGNTLPFRVRIVNRLNDNYDYFYVKRVDANRIYGLELEHILSPNRINYFINGTTLIEDHIIGIPAEAFVRDYVPANRFDQVRLAKEFVKFNERCFVRLLGDMHSGNFVVDIARDFEKWQYRMRPIDFDQQSHHWRKQVYMPQYFTQNNPLVLLGMDLMTPATVLQYQREERALMANRLRVSRTRYEHLMAVMREDVISAPSNVHQLRTALAQHYGTSSFEGCETMGELVYESLRQL